MRILLINGSPKNSNSSSELMMNELSKQLGESNEYITINTSGLSKKIFLDMFTGVDTAVFIFPLYVDGIPSHLLRLLYESSDELRDISPNVVVYAIANNGFYEGEQNALALNMIRHFCDAAGVKWGQGLGIGGGGMLGVSQIGVGPLKDIGIALSNFAANINKNKSGDNVFTHPNFPKLLYKIGAHFNFIQMAKKNGVNRKALYKRHL